MGDPPVAMTVAGSDSGAGAGIVLEVPGSPDRQKRTEGANPRFGLRSGLVTLDPVREFS